MQKVYLYYEANYNRLADDCDACSDIHVYSNRDNAKKQMAMALKIHAGSGITEPAYYQGCNRFVVDKDHLDDAGITIDEDDKLTDEQIDILIENVFMGCESCTVIRLFATEQENWDEYFTIHVDETEVE